MEEAVQFILTDKQVDLLREYAARIRFLYDVELRIEVTEKHSDKNHHHDCNDFVKLEVWIKSMIEKSSNVAQAKKYIQSVCSVDKVERRCQYTQEIFHHLLRCRDRIERLSGAVLVFKTYEHEVLVWGQEYNVTNALFMLDQSAQLYVSQSQKVDHQIGNDEDTKNYQREPVTRVCSSSSVFTDKFHRRKLEAVDSSYDSDSESYVNPNEDHNDVSRTVSDTLGAEFSEYINIDTNKLVSSLCESEHSTEENSDESSASDGQYTNRVEFALKLGYTEDQVQLALQKLGSNPEQNELLAELIRLGASGPNTKPLEEPLLPDSTCSVLAEASDTSKGLTPTNYEDSSESSNLRHIVIDGSNVAMSHGNKETFSCRGIKICVDWFKQRGHKEITVFVPQWRKETSRQEPRIVDQEILFQLERDRMLAFTPSRLVGGRRLICYDDRYILKLAAAVDGIVVSNDNYRDLINESQEYKKTVDERLLMFTFVSDRFMPPDDPLGRHGPSLDNFLKKQSKTSEMLHRICPYLKKCTYGNKCKYQHPERGNMPQKLVSEMLAEQGKHQIQERKSRGNKSSLRSTVSLPTMSSSDKKKEGAAKKPLARTSTNFASNMSRKFTESIPERKVDESIRSKVTHTSSSPLMSSGQSLFIQPDQLPHPQNQHFEPSFSRGVETSGRTNIHRKLQREPSVNTAYDSHLKLSQVKQYGGFQGVHPPLSRNNQIISKWNASQSQQSIWNVDHDQDRHQAVTRIASAPDSCQQQWSSINQPRFAMKMRQASTSDSQLNIFNESTNSLLPQFSWLNPQEAITSAVPVSQGSLWSNAPSFSHGAIGQRMGQPANLPMNSLSISNTTSQSTNQNAASVDPSLIYHLCSLFPSEQVQAVRQLYPHETNPQKLCATILSMFPPSSNE